MFASVLTKWNLDPTVITGLLVLVGIYWRHREDSHRDGWFAAVVVLTILALESPLDFLADRYLFSAHMLQHMILLMVVAPLLVLAAPPALIRDLRRAPRWLRAVAGQPVLVLVVSVADVLVWHLPPLYETTLYYEPVHVLEHLSFVLTALPFWWIAFAPDHENALPVLGRMAYVFLAGIPTTLLGVLITFAPSVLYPSYQLALDQPGLGRALTLEWGISALADQQLGGLLMWILGGIIYLVAIIAIFLTWYARQPTQEGVTTRV